MEQIGAGEPERGDLGARGGEGGGRHQGHEAGADEDEAEDELGGDGGFFGAELDPQPTEQRGEGDEEDGVEGLEPGGGEGKAEELVVGFFVGEEVERGAGLFKRRPEDGGDQEQDEDDEDALAFGRGPGAEVDAGEDDADDRHEQDAEGVGELGDRGGDDAGADQQRDAEQHGEADPEIALLRGGFGGGGERGGVKPGLAEVLAAEEELDEAERHAGADDEEGEAPFDHLAHIAADEGSEEGPDVDAHVVDGKAGVAAVVAGFVEGADQGGDVGLEESGAEADEGEAEVEHFDRGRGEAEVADGDAGAAVDYGLALAEEAVGEPAAGDAHQIDERDDHAVDGGAFAFVELQAGGGDHVEQQERAHAVVAEALPHFGEEEGGQAPGVAEESGV